MKFGNIELLNLDCMEYMKGVPDKYYDLAICDPPYGINVNMNAGRKKGTRSKKRIIKKWDSQAPTEAYFIDLFRVSKNQIIWGANHMIDRIKINKQGWIFWDKCVAEGCSFSDGELAWTSFDQSLKKAVVPYSGFIGMEGEKFHPTTKPIKLYKWLLKNYAKDIACKECDNGRMLDDDSDGSTIPCEYCNGTLNRKPRIIDTHGGSMSIAIACHEYGLPLTVCEIDEDYYDAGVKRFKNHIAQQKLFV